MKKFSNITNEEIKVKELPLNMEQKVSKIINDNINIKINGDAEELANKNLTIDGKPELLKKIQELIELEEGDAISEVSNTLKYNYNHFINQNVLNATISKLKEQYLNLYTVPSPEMVFSNEDYEITSDDSIRLYGTQYIPSIYVDYLKIEEAVKFFKNGGKVNIRYNCDKWEISFEGNYSNYGTSISSHDEKYKQFINENSEFISSFYEATSALIGDNNIILMDKKLI